MKKAAFILLLLMPCLTFAQQSPRSFISDSLDKYVSTALEAWQIPGAAICIVKDGEVDWMKGYGVRELNKNEKVDEHTLFMIGSNTKAFTATALAMLHTSGKLSLDDRVQKWVPDFRMNDPWVSKEANIRDLLCHRLGFETFQGDFMFFDSDLTKQEVKEKMGKLKPVYSFRSKWGYCNSAFMIGGEVIEKATGKTWAEFMRDSIFKPLGMNESLPLSIEIEKAGNRASAHTVTSGILKKVPYGKIDNLAPAGSISSSISDMSRWVMAQLEMGMYNGTQVIPSRAIGITWTPHSILGNGGTYFNTGHFLLYGLGWMVSEYNGKKIVAHTGGVNGFVTSVTLVPEMKLGIIVFTNTDANSFYEAAKLEILDAYMGLPYRDYSALTLKQYEEGNKMTEEWLKLKRDTIAMVKNKSSLSAYTGEYVSDVYGKMNMKLEGGKLIARFDHHSGREAQVDMITPDRFLATFNDHILGTKEWVFKRENGKVKSVTVRVADFVEFTPYEFVKK